MAESLIEDEGILSDLGVSLGGLCGLRRCSYQFMSRLLQHLCCSSCPLFLNQHVVGIESRNRKNGDAIRRQRLDERKQHSGQIERKWALELQTDPVMLRVHVGRKVVGRA